MPGKREATPVSQKQRRTMRAVAANPALGSKMGISRSVAREFNANDPGGKLPMRVSKGKPVRGASDDSRPRNPPRNVSPTNRSPVIPRGKQQQAYRGRS